MSDSESGQGAKRLEELGNLRPIRREAGRDDFKRQRTDGLRGGPRTLEECKAEILRKCDDFLVINKPADVRLDGDFAVSVQKIVRRLLPELDKPRWVHQLDFATSGILCIGLNRIGAANACKLFRERKTCKFYLAIVRGTLRPAQPWSKALSSPLAANTTPTAASVSWPPPLAGPPQPARPGSPAAAPVDAPASHSSEAAAYRYAAAAAPIQVREAWTPARTFRATADDGESTVKALLSPLYGDCAAATGSLPCFEVSGPIATVPDDFRMVIDPENGREARTEVVPVEYGWLGGEQVTKVLLRPVQGRRHQLRLHLLHLGFPILGDATYGPVFQRLADTPSDAFFQDQQRMYLHALRLELPFESSGMKIKRSHASFMPQGLSDVNLETTDPFPLAPSAPANAGHSPA